MDKKQLIVIGAGPGGYAAAFLAADQGMKVTLVDLETNPGGVCLNWGCIPSKAYLHVADVLHLASESKSFGVHFQTPHIDIAALRDWKQQIVTKLTQGLGALAKARKIEFIQGRASFIDDKNLKVTLPDKSENQFTFEHAIIATGSRPKQLPGVYLESPRFWHSRQALDLPFVPKKLLVIGAGYIGLELGSVYSALGAQVTIVEQLGEFLPSIDPDLAEILYKRIKKTVHRIMLGTTVEKIEEIKDGFSVIISEKGSKKAEERFDCILVASGRQPNSSGIGLNQTSVATDEKGFIKVKENRQTTVKNIFAIGDVCSEPMLAHKATHEARIAVRALSGKDIAFMPLAIPAVIYTNPEVAWCGLTEQQAKKQNKDVKVVRFPWAASGRAMTLNNTDGVTKFIIDKKSERILGAGIVGTGASDMISEIVVAIEMNALASDLTWCIHPHPTLSETIMEAADVFYNESIHLYQPRKK